MGWITDIYIEGNYLYVITRNINDIYHELSSRDFYKIPL